MGTGAGQDALYLLANKEKKKSQKTSKRSGDEETDEGGDKRKIENEATK